jgi:hypothetical protein
MSSQLMKKTLHLLGITLLTLVLAVSWVLAQDSERLLISDTSVTETLDTDNPVQVYTYQGQGGEVVNLNLATPSEDQPVGFIVTDADGVRLDIVVNADGFEVTLPDDGLLYVTVYSIDGVTDEAIEFELTLTADGASTSAATFTLPSDFLTATGLQISLTWESTANLDLEVRDPVGGSLRFATPTVESGGQFGVNVNSVCNTLTANVPSEQASWPAGVVSTGSYEVLVYYQPLTDCPTSDPATFTINAVVDGEVIAPFEGTLLPNQIFIASFRVNADGTVGTGESGVRVDPPTADNVPLTGAAPLTANTPVNGVITSEQPFQVYTFTAGANDVVSVSMTAFSGSLDTLLLMLDPNGNLVGSNDDTTQGVTDSLIPNLSLVLAGEYTVIATRYGMAIGGTEGEYTLTLSGALDLTDTQTTTLAPDLPNLPNGSVEVSLQWSTGADLQLLVRDPQGAAVYDDEPTSPSGGVLAAQGNVNCTPAAGSPVSYIYWTEGRLPPAGPYEIEVQYQNQCNDTRAVVFNLNVVANGQVVLSQSQQIIPGERYVTSYNIGTDGQITAGEGGLIGTVERPEAASLDYTAQLETARIITSDEVINGSIRLNKKFDVYVFDGEAGDVVNLAMQARNGTLDPVVYLLDPSGVQIAENDDAGVDTRDALISEFSLPADGRYIIVATHFGAQFGVTSGDYTLTLRLN